MRYRGRLRLVSRRRPILDALLLRSAGREVVASNALRLTGLATFDGARSTRGCSAPPASIWCARRPSNGVARGPRAVAPKLARCGPSLGQEGLCTQPPGKRRQMPENRPGRVYLRRQ
jgi:hypothetical protein